MNEYVTKRMGNSMRAGKAEHIGRKLALLLVTEWQNCLVEGLAEVLIKTRLG